MRKIQFISPEKDAEYSKWYEKWKNDAKTETENCINSYKTKYNFKWTIDETNAKKIGVKLEIDESNNPKWAASKLKVIVITEEGKRKDFKIENTASKQTFDFTVASKPKNIFIFKVYEFSTSLYGDFKKYLIERLFDKRCAYCESDITHIDHGDVEHFRPKGEVTEDLSHPGYYWLAYNENNFLLSCAKCNQSGAKLNHFPIMGKRAMGPGDDLKGEECLIINPYEDDSDKELDFSPKDFELCSGVAAALTQKGTESIKVYNLNRDDLSRRRGETQTNVLTTLSSKISMALLSKKTETINTIIENEILDSEKHEYATAAKAAAKAYKNKLIESLKGK